MNARFPQLVEVWDETLAVHGDTHLGVGWTKTEASAAARHDTMLGVIRGAGPATLLDVGCGTAQLLDHLTSRSLPIDYTGLDLSERMLEVARAKHSATTFFSGDLRDLGDQVPPHDFVVMSGLFTYRGPLSVEEITAECRALVRSAYDHARVGIAFNTTSPYVDWEREDLWHAPVSVLSALMAELGCRNFQVLNDDSRFETTVYAYRSPRLRVD